MRTGYTVCCQDEPDQPHESENKINAFSMMVFHRQFVEMVMQGLILYVLVLIYTLR